MDADLSPRPESDARPGSPFPPAPEQPRLGIIHLLAWTVCVAVYFSASRAIFPSQVVEQNQAALVYWLLHGIGSGTALGGFLLFVVRRLRGLSFPEQPGETLLVLLGVGAVGETAQYWLATLARTETPAESVWPLFVAGSSLLSILLLGILYVIAIVRTKTPRWRLYFIVVVAAAVAAFLLPSTGAFGIGAMGMAGHRRMLVLQLAPSLLRRVVLVAVALKDFTQRKRYRWTHWLGVGVDLWSGAVWAAWLAWCGLFASP